MFKCPTEGCDTEMKLIEVNRVYGEAHMDVVDEPIRELIVDQKVGIFYCEKCSHSIIVQHAPVKDERIITPNEPKIILT